MRYDDSDSGSRDRHLNIAEKTEVEDILRMCEINLIARLPPDAAMLTTEALGIAAAISGSDVTKSFQKALNC